MSGESSTQDQVQYYELEEDDDDDTDNDDDTDDDDDTGEDDTSHDCDVHDDESNNDCVDDDERDHDEDDDTSQYESDHESDDDAEGFDDIDVEQCMTLLDNLTPSEAADPVQSTLPSATCSDDTELRPWRGFKIVGNNVDKNFRRSFQRMDYQMQSLYKIKHLYVCHIRDIGTVDDVTRGPKARG